MKNLDNVFNKYKQNADDVDKWAEAQYQVYFAEHFKKVNDLYARLKSNNNPITDDELEWILTWLPLELINVSEKLSKMKTMQESIKAQLKQAEAERIELLTSEVSATKAKETVAVELADDKLLISVYDIIYERVSRQVTFAKELIMSSKKIWDARRNSEQPMPSISENDLPEYQQPEKPSTYIK